MKIYEILNFYQSRLWLFGMIYFLCFIVITLDLWAGIRKAKKRGEFRSSFGLRKTVDKAVRYFNLLLALTVFDCIQMLSIYHLNPQMKFSLPIFPAFTVLGAFFICLIEIKSIYESAEKKEKAKMKEAAQLAAMIVANNNAKEVADKILQLLKENKDGNIPT